MPVARRSFETPGNQCAPLARAAAVWVALVFDAQTDDRKDDESEETRPLEKDAPTPAEQSSRAIPLRVPDHAEDAEQVHSRPPRSLEVGSSGFVAGALDGGHGIGGGALFVIIEGPQQIFFRMGLAAGSPTLGLARFDTCLRFAGFYPKGGGMQIDGCAGLEGGLAFEQTRGFLSTGPAIGWRADLSMNLILELRGMVNLNMVGGETYDRSRNTSFWLTQRAELGLLWRVR